MKFCWGLIFCLGVSLSCQEGAVSSSTVSVDDFEVIARGDVVDLTKHLANSDFTVFDFYADWCPPCKQLDASLVDLKLVYGDRLTVRKLDLVDWKSAMATHFKIRDLPYLMVYDANKNKVADGPSKQVLPQLVKMLNQ